MNSFSILQLGSTMGPYKVTRPLGIGGMGEVYEAYESRLSRKVALKVIRKEQAGQDPHVLQRFLSEAKALAKVSHPNVVTVFAIDTHGDIEYIAMEYVEGRTLRDILDRYALSAEEALPLFRQVLEGLEALHQAGVLHRDVKPQNLIFRDDGRVKILDLGLAKDVDGAPVDLTAVGLVIGTINYLAPELARGEKATIQSDLWSLGAIFYEALSGDRLIKIEKGESSLSVLEKVKTVRIEFPPECSTWAPEPVQAFVRKLCAPALADRYLNATEALAELRRLEDALPATGSTVLKIVSRELVNEAEAAGLLRKQGLAQCQVKRALAVAAARQDQLDLDSGTTRVTGGGIHISPDAREQSVKEISRPVSLAPRAEKAAGATARAAPRRAVLSPLPIAAAVLLLLAGTAATYYWRAKAPPPAASFEVPVSGSSTVTPLLRGLASAYDQGRAPRVGVEATGSEEGIRCTLNRKCLIGMSSHSVDAGVSPDLEVIPLGWDAVVFVAGKAARVESLTTQQIKDIYSLRVKNWKELGGADLAIEPVQWATKHSGREIVDKQFGLKSYASEATSVEEIYGAIAKAGGGGIGYVSFGVATKQDHPEISILALDGTRPSVKTIQDGAYPLKRELVLLRNRTLSSAPRDEFLDYVKKNYADQMFKLYFIPNK